MQPASEQLLELADLLATDLDRHFPQLLLSTQQRLFAFAFRQTGSRQDAEEIRSRWIATVIITAILCPRFIDRGHH